MYNFVFFFLCIKALKCYGVQITGLAIPSCDIIATTSSEQSVCVLILSVTTNVVDGAGSVISSAGTYMACTEVIEPFFVDVILSCSWPISVANVGWYPTAEGILPNSTDTSDPT